MKKLTLLIGILLLYACSIERDLEVTDKPIKHHITFIKAVHYFADAWPKTFWQEFEKGKVTTDFKQIKKDGFNTIILVVPWKGFELNFSGNQTKSNPKMYERLDFLLNKIKQNNLDYMLRLGFPHDYTENTGTNVYSLCTNMYEDTSYQKKWSDYLNNIKQITKKYPNNQAGILVSWEDFWCPHFVFPLLEQTRRIELAQNTGFADWLMQKDITTLKVILAKNNIKKEEIAIPMKEDMAYFYYIDFIDQKFDELILNPSKKILANTGMEIRIDKDPATSSIGSKIWIAHDLHLAEKNHRGTYWAPFWGAENNYETLTLDQALFNFEYFLNYVTDQGKFTNHVLEQFNFVDNTPYFPNHAKLAENDVDEFLQKSAPLLKKYSSGYGIWSYHDYVDNSLYNSSFEFGLDGWEHQDATIVGDENDQQLRLESTGFISQNFQSNNRLLLTKSYSTLKLCINTENIGKIAVYINDLIDSHLDLKKGEACYVIAADGFKQNQTSFKIVAESDVTIDELKLYGFVQKLDVYDEFNKQSKFIESIRKLNKVL